MSIYQHFREEEHPFIDHILSIKDIVLKTYRYHLTDFLDPREQQMVLMVIGENSTDLKVHFSGGANNAERKRAIIAPYYDTIEEGLFNLRLLQANYASKFMTIEHRDVMGAFMSLGVTRQKLGDIYVADGNMQIITDNDIAPFIIANLIKIKKANIQLREQQMNEVIERKEDWRESEHYVSSLRLDGVITEIYHLSRKVSAMHISRGNVKVNFKTVSDAKFTVYEGDLISVRGLGRSKVIYIHEGLTRKGRTRMTAGMLK
ncbi:MAG TPA: YlmH/Sll1252 family protein [Bacillota bacterium]|nr:YlmH/Sll1252 family protein [Bacillota bacterium]